MSVKPSKSTEKNYCWAYCSNWIFTI